MKKEIGNCRGEKIKWRERGKNKNAKKKEKRSDPAEITGLSSSDAWYQLIF